MCPLRVVGWLVAWSFCLSCSVRGQTSVNESQVKAAFLYKFGSYVEWPAQTFEGPDAAFVIGVMASDDTAAALTQMTANHAIDGRHVIVRKILPGESLTGLQVIFIGHVDTTRMSETLAATKGQPVLTVTESEPRLFNESMINFVVVDDKVRFDVSLPAVEQGNLKISARLLGVARKVIPRPS